MLHVPNMLRFRCKCGVAFRRCGLLPVLLLLLLLMLLWLLLLLLIKVEDVCKHFGSRDIVTADSNGRQLGPGFWETGAAGVAMGTRKTLVQIGAG